MYIYIISFSWFCVFFLQDSVKFVKEIVNEDEATAKGNSGEKCSRILLWNFPIRASGILVPAGHPNGSSSLPRDTQR